MAVQRVLNGYPTSWVFYARSDTVLFLMAHNLHHLDHCANLQLGDYILLERQPHRRRKGTRMCDCKHAQSVLIGSQSPKPHFALRLSSTVG
jgi:hypothetical protein